MTSNLNRGISPAGCGRNSPFSFLSPSIASRLTFAGMPLLRFTYFLCPLPLPLFCHVCCHQQLVCPGASVKALSHWDLPMTLSHPSDPGGSSGYSVFIIYLFAFCLDFHSLCREQWGAVLYPRTHSPHFDYFFLMRSYAIYGEQALEVHLLHCLELLLQSGYINFEG